MGNKFDFRRIAIFSVMFFLGACFTTPVPIPSATSTIAPPTATSHPVGFATTPTPPSPTVKSTIDLEFEKEYVMQMLKGEKHSCKLPCLWDIEPGKSSWTNLQEVFDPLGYSLTPSDYGPKEGISLAFALNDIRNANLFINFIGDVGKIEYSRLQASLYRPEDRRFDEEFTEVFRQYSLQTVLSEYGPPSVVLIDNLAGGGGPGPSIFYVIHLYYYDTGLVFEYVFEDGLHQGSETVTLCPDHEYMTDFLLVASTPDNPSVLFGFGGDFRNLEDMSDFPIEEFTELFATSTDSVCFETFYP